MIDFSPNSYLNRVLAGLLLSSLYFVSGCASQGNTNVDYVGTNRGHGEVAPPKKHVDPLQEGSLNTVNMESDDVEGCAQYMVGKMMANPMIVSSSGVRNVIMDSSYFTIRTSQRLDKDLIVDALRTEMIRAANGRIRFSSRERSAVVEEENALREEGVVGAGTLPSSQHQLGADYRLTGRLTEMAGRDATSLDKYIQIVFEMIDTQTNEIVFGDRHTLKKYQSYSAVYR